MEEGKKGGLRRERREDEGGKKGRAEEGRKGG